MFLSAKQSAIRGCLNVNSIRLTSSVVDEIRSAWDAHRCSVVSPLPVQEQTEMPFGIVYFGPYVRFAAGKHYGMAATPVRGRYRGRSPQGVGPLIPFCPITSTKQSGRRVIRLPPATLPPKTGDRGERLLVTSYLLLFIILPVGRYTLSADFTYVCRLNQELCERAQGRLRTEPWPS